MNQPKSISELQDVVRGSDRIRPFGGRTKVNLVPDEAGDALVDMGALSGILEYDPNEYTFTAYAGTPVQEIADALAENGQYMPFDPLFASLGATLGGSVAANTSGSGRFRYGGIRDFILGTRFVDGNGRLVQGGGKVVKNAAGFDLPKFLVGSLGRFGLLADVTFKVFPAPPSAVTLLTRYKTVASAIESILALATTSLEIDALDIQIDGAEDVVLVARLRGLETTESLRIGRLQRFLQENGTPTNFEVLKGPEENGLWESVNRFEGWNCDDALVKVPLAPKQVLAFDQLSCLRNRRYTAGGNVAWVTVTDLTKLNHDLLKLGLSGLVLGQSEPVLIGANRGYELMKRVKMALDPNGRFGNI